MFLPFLVLLKQEQSLSQRWRTRTVSTLLSSTQTYLEIEKDLGLVEVSTLLSATQTTSHEPRNNRH